MTLQTLINAASWLVLFFLLFMVLRVWSEGAAKNLKLIGSHDSENHEEQQYLDLLRQILDKGVDSDDRTGVGTKSIFGYQMRFDLAQGFPLITTRKIFTKGMIAELLWVISGSTNNRVLTDQGVNIWTKWANKDGELGPVYGAVWRAFGPHRIDQLKEVIANLKNNPFSRRHVVTAWDPSLLPIEAYTHEENIKDGRQVLAPCHCMFQFRVRQQKSGKHILDCQLYQRSADVPVGVPYNIAFYSLLTMMVAQCVDMLPGEFVWTGGDCHIYKDQLSLVEEQVTRVPFPFPTMTIPPDWKSIDGFDKSEFKLEDYRHHEHLPYPVAV